MYIHTPGSDGLMKTSINLEGTSGKVPSADVHILLQVRCDNHMQGGKLYGKKILTEATYLSVWSKFFIITRSVAFWYFVENWSCCGTFVLDAVRGNEDACTRY